MNELVLACLEDMAYHQGKVCADGGMCWCGWPDVRPCATGNHSVVCHELREYFKVKERQENKNA